MDQTFGRNAQNCLDKTRTKDLAGALACLETFYYAFNECDIETFRKIWLNNDFIQLNNPLGGIIRGNDAIVELYDRIFNGQVSVWVEFMDIVYYQSTDMVTFAGREIGEYSVNGDKIELRIRTTRFFGYSEEAEQWYQVHHHGSIDNAELLDRYQRRLLNETD